MKFFDLFSGIGGFHLGMSRAGHECVGACEIDPAFTLTTFTHGCGIYDGAWIRHFTEHELERLMGFPDDWTAGVGIKDRTRILANAVVPQVVEYLAKQL